MLNDRHKNILRIACLILVLCMVIPPVINTWYWRQDHFTLFDLSQELQKNGTNFYEWLGIEPTASLSQVSKAHRQLVLKLHPKTSTELDAQSKFDTTNQIAHILKSPTLRPLYDSILQQGHLPYFKGVLYYYTHHKLICMIILVIVSVTLMDYLKAWDKYLSDKLTFDQFVINAKMMATKISDKHASAKTHKNWIDLGHGYGKKIQCEITPEKEIFILNEKNERVPLDSANLLTFPSLFNTFLFRIPKYILGSSSKSAATAEERENKNK